MKLIWVPFKWPAGRWVKVSDRKTVALARSSTVGDVSANPRRSTSVVMSFLPLQMSIGKRRKINKAMVGWNVRRRHHLPSATSMDLAVS